MPLQEYEDYEEEYDQDPQYDYYYGDESDSESAKASTEAWANFLGPWVRAYDESRKTTPKQHKNSTNKVHKARKTVSDYNNITPRKPLSVIEEESAPQNYKAENNRTLKISLENPKREPTKYHSKITASQNYNDHEPRKTLSATDHFTTNPHAINTSTQAPKPNRELISKTDSLKMSIRHSKDRPNLKREPTKYHPKNSATQSSNHHGPKNTANQNYIQAPKQARHSKDKFNPKREPTKYHSTNATTHKYKAGKRTTLKISMENPKREQQHHQERNEPTKYHSKTTATQNFNQTPKHTPAPNGEPKSENQNFNHQVHALRKEESTTVPTKKSNYERQAQQAQNFKLKQAQQVINNNIDNDNDDDNDIESNPILNINSWTSSCESYPNNLQATTLNSSAFYVTAFARSQVKHMKPLCKKKKPPQFTILKSRASPPDSTLINDYVTFQNLAFEHAMVHSHMNPSTDTQPYRLLTMLLPKSSKQTSLKKRKASEVEVTHQEITTSSKHKSFPIPVPVPAVTSSWKRPNLFTGGFANAIPFLEFTLMNNSTIPIQKTKSANFQLAATTVLIRTLAYLAQPVIHINHLKRISTANRLLFLAIQAVPFVTPATETPFRSTGPGPPRNSINHQKRRATHHENAQQFSNPSSSVSPITRTTTCPYDTPKNLKTLPILCQPSHGSTHGNTDTSNAVLVSKNSTTVITPPPPHENNTVSTPQNSKVNANADFHPAETETQENPNKNLKGGHKCRSKLVT